jgi:hypothetical protein
MIRIGTHASAKANATGTRRNMKRKKRPKRMIAAWPGDRTVDIMA